MLLYIRGPKHDVSVLAFIGIITFFFPCVTFGQIAEITDRGMSSKSNCVFYYI
jgi:hypothetical protein